MKKMIVWGAVFFFFVIFTRLWIQQPNEFAGSENEEKVSRVKDKVEEDISEKIRDEIREEIKSLREDLRKEFNKMKQAVKENEEKTKKATSVPSKTIGEWVDYFFGGGKEAKEIKEEEKEEAKEAKEIKEEEKEEAKEAKEIKEEEEEEEDLIKIACRPGKRWVGVLISPSGQVRSLTLHFTQDDPYLVAQLSSSGDRLFGSFSGKFVGKIQGQEVLMSLEDGYNFSGVSLKLWLSDNDNGQEVMEGEYKIPGIGSWKVSLQEQKRRKNKR